MNEEIEELWLEVKNRCGKLVKSLYFKKEPYFDAGIYIDGVKCEPNVVRSYLKMDLKLNEMYYLAMNHKNESEFNAIQKIGDYLWETIVFKLIETRGQLLHNLCSKECHYYIMSRFDDRYTGMNKHKVSDIFEFWVATGLPIDIREYSREMIKTQKEILKGAELGEINNALSFVKNGGLLFINPIQMSSIFCYSPSMKKYCLTEMGEWECEVRGIKGT